MQWNGYATTKFYQLIFPVYQVRNYRHCFAIFQLHHQANVFMLAVGKGHGSAQSMAAFCNLFRIFQHLGFGNMQLGEGLRGEGSVSHKQKGYDSATLNGVRKVSGLYTSSSSVR